MILLDTGPLVAVVDADDQYHARCTGPFRKIREPLWTIWPVLSQAMYFMRDLPQCQRAVWQMIERDVIRILPLDAADVPRIRELMHTYRDLPMDLADAALVRVAEREGAREFFTIDRKDFSVYRLHGRIRPKIIP